MDIDHCFSGSIINLTNALECDSSNVHLILLFYTAREINEIPNRISMSKVSVCAPISASRSSAHYHIPERKSAEGIDLKSERGAQL